MINVQDCGLIGDGKENETKKLQSIIDSLSDGGTILIPSGMTIKISGLQLRSNITLHLEANATLLGSEEYSDYKVLSNDKYQGQAKQAMVFANDAKNITISGSGVIDGNGLSFISEKTRYIYKLDRYPRITTMFFENIENLIIEGVTITNGCYWTIHPVGCKNIKFRGLTINQDTMMPNCDGIDPDHCQEVIISDCNITCADDCIVLKNTEYFAKYGSTKNVVVTNCILRSTSAGFKIGTESCGDFENICFSNSIITDSNRGIALQLRDGGNVSNVLINNIIIKTRKFDDIWWGKGEPVAITTYQRVPGVSELSMINNIRMFNLEIESENAIYISSQKPGYISNIILSNINMQLVQKSKWTKHQYDNRPYGSEHSGLFSDQMAGIYTKNVIEYEVDNFKFESKIKDTKVEQMINR